LAATDFKRAGQISPDSALLRLIAGTKYTRFLGKRLIPSYRVTVDGDIKLILRTGGSDLSVDREVFESRDYEKYFRPEEGQTVVDIGAHIGCFTVRAAKLVGEEGKILAFEPSSANFSVLCRNIALNGLHNVHTFNCALFDEDRDDAELFISRSLGSNSLSKRKDKGMEFLRPEKVALRTLDGVLKDANVSRVHFIKIDAEGSELAILKGGENTIKRYQPKIAGEAHPSFSNPGKSIIDYLARFGYSGRIEGDPRTLEIFNAWPPAK
jgi:FkbM family methyltransferase